MASTPAGTAQHAVAVAGATGRMGHMLIEAIRASGDCQLTGAMDVPASPAIGNDAAAFLGVASGVPVVSDPRAGLARARVLIDFTRPEGTMAHLAACRDRASTRSSAPPASRRSRRTRSPASRRTSPSSWRPT